MNRTYFYESFMNHKYRYDINDNEIRFSSCKSNLTLRSINLNDIDKILPHFVKPYASVFDVEKNELLRIYYKTEDSIELIETIISKLPGSEKKELAADKASTKRTVSVWFYLFVVGWPLLAYYGYKNTTLFTTFYTMLFLVYNLHFLFYYFFNPRKIKLNRKHNELEITYFLFDRKLPLKNIIRVYLNLEVIFFAGYHLILVFEMNNGNKIKLFFMDDILKLYMVLRQKIGAG